MVEQNHIVAGAVYGRLTAISPATGRLWLFHCECGNETLLNKYRVRSGNTKSCGCLNVARITKHGLSKTPEWWVYNNMKSRVLNPRSPVFHHYGGRGITICNRWLGQNGFANFFADMGPRPSPKHSIERVDNEGPYSPDNCVWANKTAQARNTRRNLLVTYNGETKTAGAWEAVIGIKACTIYSRIQRGWSAEEAITTPRLTGKRSSLT